MLFLARCKNDALYFGLVSESQCVGHMFEKAFAMNADCVWLESDDGTGDATGLSPVLGWVSLASPG